MILITSLNTQPLSPSFSLLPLTVPLTTESLLISAENANAPGNGNQVHDSLKFSFLRGFEKLGIKNKEVRHRGQKIKQNTKTGRRREWCKEDEKKSRMMSTGMNHCNYRWEPIFSVHIYFTSFCCKRDKDFLTELERGEWLDYGAPISNHQI